MVEYQSVAVVDANPNSVIVWQVDVSSNPSGLSRMSGAWVLGVNESKTLKTLTQNRLLAATDAGLATCKRAEANGYAANIDLALTLAEVAAEVDRLQASFEQAAAESKSALVPPTWPKLPQAFAGDKPPVNRTAPTEAAVALGIARWLESVALAWESLEQQRLMRKYFRGDNDGRRRLPIVELSSR